MSEGVEQHEDTPFVEARQILEDAWSELRRTPFVSRQIGDTLTRLPDVSFAAVQRRSRVGATLLKHLNAIDVSKLPHELSLSLRSVRFRALAWSREADWYWIVTDPLGNGYFGLFLPSAYCGGLFLNMINSQIAAFTFDVAHDKERYLALVADYARLIDQFTTRTAEQASRGIRIPREQIPKARLLLERTKTTLRDVFCAAPQRMLLPGKLEILGEVQHVVTAAIEPAFDRALGVFSDSYAKRAPEAVGIGQYPEGAEIYAELVKFHTTLEMTPEQIHTYGHERLAEIETQKQAIRSELAFEGDDATFLEHLNQDSRWFADTAEGVTKVFHNYISRITPHLSGLFSAMPNSPCEVAALPEALEGSMTYGYYDPPRKNNTTGLYRFNAGNLTKQPLFSLAGLTYHELMPGHHLQLALAYENEDLHPFRRYSLLTAYAEGWAEYAATLAGEIGMYEHAAERYGRLVNDALLTTRLIVDTGMNALGWPLERARDHMRQHSGLSEGEIVTESMRYSCDIPGQALAYKVGDHKLTHLRERMRRALGAHFDLKTFHAAVLGAGAVPLLDLDWHVDHEIGRLSKTVGI